MMAEDEIVRDIAKAFWTDEECKTAAKFMNKIVFDYSSRYKTVMTDDLVQQAYLGLYNAIRAYGENIEPLQIRGFVISSIRRGIPQIKNPSTFSRDTDDYTDDSLMTLSELRSEDIVRDCQKILTPEEQEMFQYMINDIPVSNRSKMVLAGKSIARTQFYEIRKSIKNKIRTYVYADSNGVF